MSAVSNTSHFSEFTSLSGTSLVSERDVELGRVPVAGATTDQKVGEVTRTRLLRDNEEHLKKIADEQAAIDRNLRTILDLPPGDPRRCKRIACLWGIAAMVLTVILVPVILKIMANNGDR